MTRRWDVIVVGAGVAGAATSMLLARAGMHVLCVDRAPRERDRRGAHALVRGGVLQLNSWGLLDDLIAAGTPPVRRTLVSYGEESVAVSIKPSDGVDALYAPRRPVLEGALVGGAERAGAVVEFAARVTGLHRDDAGRVAGVVVGDRHAGAEWTVRAPLVIGADGRDSLIAREVVATPASTGRQNSSVLFGYWANFPTDGFESAYRSGLTTGAVPTNNGLACVYISGAPDRIAAELARGTASSAFDRLSVPVGLDLRIAAADQAEPVRTACGLPAGYLRAAHGPGWALVGDAGHWIDPLSLHGMTAALRDAALLARAVLSIPPHGGRFEALANYQSVRDRLSMPMLRATDEIAAYNWDLPRLRTLLRNLSSAMTDEVETLATIGSAA